MRRRPRPCECYAGESHANECCDPDNSYESDDSNESHESNDFNESDNPNDPYESHDPNESCNPDEFHEPGGRGQPAVNRWRIFDPYRR